LAVLPSPKLHCQAIILPVATVELSLNFIESPRHIFLSKPNFAFGFSVTVNGKLYPVSLLQVLLDVVINLTT
jgi:hypothetical protein